MPCIWISASWLKNASHIHHSVGFSLLRLWLNFYLAFLWCPSQRRLRTIYLQGIAKDENIDAEEDALHLIAQKADGAMRDALSIFDQMASFGKDGKITYADVIENLNILDYDYYFKMVDGFLDGDISSVLVNYDEIQRNGFDGQLFINGLANHFRDLLVAQNANSQQLLEKSKEIAGRYHKQALAVTPPFIINDINILG